MSLSTSNKSLIQVVGNLIEFADRHLQLQEAGVGTVFEINTTTQNYPLMWIETIPFGFTPNTVQYNFRIYLMDILQPDISNELDIQSDMTQIAWDLYMTIRDAYDYEPVINGQINPFTEEYDDRVAGVWFDLGIIIPRELGVCDAPSNRC